MTCIICTDETENDNLLKLCICVDSKVCLSCYNELNKNNIEKCPVCRRDLEIVHILNKKQYMINIFKNLFYTIFFLIVQLCYPTFLIIYEKQENLYFNKITYGCLIFLSIFIIEPINYKLLNDYEESIFNTRDLEKDFVSYYKIVRTISIVTNILCLSYYEGKKKDLLYFFLVIMIFIYGPMIIFNTLININRLHEYKNNLYKKCKINRILIRNPVLLQNNYML